MSRAKIVGILNVTPDSYFDGGKYVSIDQAVARVKQMVQEGADVIEVGGQSTGPGSMEVSIDEELHRTIPVIEAIHKKFPAATISIDTFQSAVAKQAIEAGATMVNDVTAGRYDPQMLSVIANACRGTACCAPTRLVLMYSKDPTPRTTIDAKQYDDVITTVHQFLQQRRDQAIQQGMASDHIILDPGLGHFISSEPQYSYTILDQLEKFLDLNCPLFVSPSRKSFLAGSDNLPPADRLPATLAASITAVKNGASYIRTHDVLETKKALSSIP